MRLDNGTQETEGLNILKLKELYARLWPKLVLQSLSN